MSDWTALFGLPGYEISEVLGCSIGVLLRVRYEGAVNCPHCGGVRHQRRDRRTRKLRHDSIGLRGCVVELETCKWRCRDCGKQFWQRFPGILPYKRATEPYRRTIFVRHWDGMSRSRIAKREQIGAATVERWYEDGLERVAAERRGASCPRILGIDEHFFSRRHGYATTLCDLGKHNVYNVVLGRSEAALGPYLSRLEGKQDVAVVCMDLSPSYRALARTHFPNAKIVADRFHVIRLVNQHFLATWRLLDPVGSKHRGLVSLMRRHATKLSDEQRGRLQQYWTAQPAMEAIYEFKQRLCELLLIKHRTRRQCRRLIPMLFRYVQQLRESDFAPLATLGHTLGDWTAEIARMWRFTRNNGITEGFHTKMEVLQRQAYGLRKFRTYQQRVVAMCSRLCEPD